MSMLHVVNKSPYQTNSLDTCVGYVKEGDSILLIEDGVYAAVKGGKASANLDGKVVAVLGPDLAARGIDQEKLVKGVTVVDYAGFVELTTKKDKVQSWL